MSGQPLSTVQFWPLTHLGEHYYRAFTSTPKSSAGAPLVLGALGPVLHAAADSTVPFHATGISGCGHVEYESYVESFYDRSKRTGQLAVESNVREWLTNSTIGAIPTHLVKSATVTQILKGNAAVVSQPPLCGCAGPCDCLIARLSASKRKEEVRRLLNLAIASTVVIIRKTLSEWAPNGMVVAGAPRTEPAAFAMLATRRYDSFKQIRVVGPWLLLAGVPEKIESPMSTLKRTVDRLNEGGLGQERFRSEFEQAVGVLSRAFGENPEVLTKERPGLLRIRMSGLPPILPGPARFRVPTAAERDVDAGWSAYVALSDRFYQALLLYQSGIHAAVLNAVRRDVSRERQERIDRTLKGLAASQDDSMKALARR